MDEIDIESLTGGGCWSTCDYAHLDYPFRF